MATNLAACVKHILEADLRVLSREVLVLVHRGAVQGMAVELLSRDSRELFRAAVHRAVDAHHDELRAHLLEDLEEAVQALVLVLFVLAAPQDIHEAGAHGVEHVVLLRDLDGGTSIEHVHDVVKVLVEAVELDVLDTLGRAHEAIDDLAEKLLVVAVDLCHLRDAVPGARRRPATLEVLLLHVEQIHRPVLDEADDRRMHVVRHSPLAPLLVISVKLDVHEAVGQSRGHAQGYGTVSREVAGRHDVPAIRDFVEVADLAVEDELVSSHLARLVTRGDLIEEDDPLGVGVTWPEVGRVPLHDSLVLVDRGKTTDVDRLHLSQADVYEPDAELLSDLADDRALTDTRRRVDEDRRDGSGHAGVLDDELAVRHEDLFELAHAHAVVCVDSDGVILCSHFLFFLCWRFVVYAANSIKSLCFLSFNC